MLIYRGTPARPLSPVALTIGNFDGVHIGHRAMLARLTQAARERGLSPCVMTFEPHPREFFTPEQAPARLSNLREKLELFERFGVERVFILRFNKRFAQVSAEDFIDRILHQGLQARWVLVGDDFRFGAKRAGDFTMLQQAGKQYGFEVEAMDSVTVSGQRASSTVVREALARGNLTLAERFLGRHYSISGKVVHGASLGRKIGFPTANIQMKHNKPPLTGVFAVEVHGIGDKPLQGAASLGVRPTINDQGKATLEVFLFDFNGDLYNKHLHVEFLLKLRDEMKFPSLEALTAQIAVDVENAKKFFKDLTAKAQRR
ncbi:MAG: bifunctional riboflavin kinase/FAD synthetase [Sulfuricella sp.]